VRVLLDTCALVWFAVTDKELTGTARTVLESLDTEVFVSAASAREIATRTRLGKWPGAEGLAADLVTIIRKLGFTELSRRGAPRSASRHAPWCPHRSL
jgi:PIN domain nuclease of toxin-antitoxin system